ncbi:MAG: DNA (cytosine-5-)-methyltransferase [Prolixibacteraceae bacterium]|nr:DNA (cytosine-5-)-methyltransferase [Prolixibacteraceae bacterium]
MKAYYSISEVADLLSVSKETLRRWDKNGKLAAVREPMSNYRVYHKDQLKIFENLSFLFNVEEDKHEEPKRIYNSIELFAGAGGLAIGLEKAGINCLALNEFDHWACETLRQNRQEWNVIEDDVKNISFEGYNGQVDIVTGGFPCQAFSYAGKKLGLKDARGTLFYEFARVVNETQPAICIGENVRGLLSHDNGRTIKGMISILNEIGYNVVTPRIFKTLFYKVPQKRERVLIVGIRKDLNPNLFEFPKPYRKVYTLKDALKKGELFDSDVPESPGSSYPEKKKAVLEMVPEGGYWRDLPLHIQKEYMGGSFYLGGGKTGMARRMSWDEPSLTLTCSPAQKQTERCHPDETRPFTIREYARIQTFPDDWKFAGSVSNQYKQIGNAVPVNFAREIGYSIVKFLNRYHSMSKP